MLFPLRAPFLLIFGVALPTLLIGLDFWLAQVGGESLIHEIVQALTHERRAYGLSPQIFFFVAMGTLCAWRFFGRGGPLACGILTAVAVVSSLLSVKFVPLGMHAFAQALEGYPIAALLGIAGLLPVALVLVYGTAAWRIYREFGAREILLSLAVLVALCALPLLDMLLT